MARCNSCGAEIQWVQTSTGARMPLDTEAIVFVPDGTGTFTLVTPGGMVYSKCRTEVRDGDQGKRLIGRVSHFATCPQAKGWRK